MLAWLLDGNHSITLGAAYIRNRYNLTNTQFDLPRVIGAYNHGVPEATKANPWGINMYDDSYVQNAGRFFNAAVAKFDDAAVDPKPPVRFKK
jgi:hypothetical protein